jgi:hypothetical protein
MEWERTWTIFCCFGGVALAAPAVPVIPGLVNLNDIVFSFTLCVRITERDRIPTEVQDKKSFSMSNLVRDEYLADSYTSN